MATIHQQIKRLREAKGWSQQRLADEVSDREGGARRLSWQTVQQWERGTAPKRTRLALVAEVLGTTVAALMEAHGATPNALDQLTGSEGQLIGLLRAMPPETRADVIAYAQERVRPQARSRKRDATGR